MARLPNSPGICPAKDAPLTQANQQVFEDAEARKVPRTFLGLSHDTRDSLWGGKAWAAYNAIIECEMKKRHLHTYAAIAEDSVAHFDCTNNAERIVQNAVDVLHYTSSSPTPAPYNSG